MPLPRYWDTPKKPPSTSPSDDWIIGGFVFGTALLTIFLVLFNAK